MPKLFQERLETEAKKKAEMDVDEMIDSFDKYYNGMWDKYNALTTNSEIPTNGR